MDKINPRELLEKQVNVFFDQEGKPQRQEVLAKARTIAEKLGTFKEFVAVVPYGSRARGYSQEGSDTDFFALVSIPSAQEHNQISEIKDSYNAMWKNREIPTINQFLNIHPEVIQTMINCLYEDQTGSPLLVDSMNTTRSLFGGASVGKKLTGYRRYFIKYFNEKFADDHMKLQAIERIAERIVAFDLSYPKLAERQRKIGTMNLKDEKWRELEQLGRIRTDVWRKRLEKFLL